MLSPQWFPVICFLNYDKPCFFSEVTFHWMPPVKSVFRLDLNPTRMDWCMRCDLFYCGGGIPWTCPPRSYGPKFARLHVFWTFWQKHICWYSPTEGRSHTVGAAYKESFIRPCWLDYVCDILLTDKCGWGVYWFWIVIFILLSTNVCGRQ